MEQSRGRIIAVANDCSRATVEADFALFCSRCASGKGCGAGVFGGDSGPRRFEAPVIGRLELRKGDEVQIELAPRSVLRAAYIVYGLPLAVALTASGAAWLAGLSDGEAVLAAIGGIALGAYLGRRRLQRSDCLRQFTPAIVGRLGEVQ